MKKLMLVFALLSNLSLFAQTGGRYLTQTGEATIFSHTVAEDITARNNTITGVINPATGEVAVLVPVQSFQFEKALMQEHFNSPHFMDSKQFPRITWKGKINNPAAINFQKDGKYQVNLSGEITIKGITRPLDAPATVEVKQGKVSVHTRFVVHDIGAFGIGKPKGSKKNNVADDIEVGYQADYQLQ